MPDERKSSRLAKRTLQSATADDYQDESDSEFDEEELVNKKRGSAAKRKGSGSTTAGSSKGQPPKKKARGMRGLLSNIVDMPVDVLFEIFGHLLPIDLWNLARTSKDLRSILMSSTSAFVWRMARKNDPHQLPDCPSDMSEPEFAALCYAKHCTTCLRVTPSPYHIWAERVRLCRKCVNVECMEFPSDLPVKFRELDVLPWVVLPGREPCVVYKAAVNALRTAIHKSKKTKSEEDIWSSKLVEEMEEREKHAKECERWLTRKQNVLEAEKESLIDQRRAEVIAYAKQLGWSDELLKSSIATTAVKQSSIINKACHKKITEQTLTGLEQFLNTFFGDLQYKHDKWKVEKKLKDRLPLLRELRDKCAARFPLNVPVISTRDLFDVPDVHSLIVDTPFSVTPSEIAKMLEPISEQFSQYMEELQSKRKETLRKMVEVAYGPEYLKGVQGDVLNLATTSFYCKSCSWNPIWSARVMAHSHCIRDPYGYGASYSSALTEAQKDEFRVVSSVLREKPWNWTGEVSFHKGRSMMLGEVIQLCGLDPKTATVEEMNNANPIIECLSCNSVYKGRTFMEWSRTVYHHHQHHSGYYNSTATKMTLKVADGPELPFVRLHLKNTREKKLSLKANDDSFCSRCNHAGNIPDLKTHWKDVHKEPATDGCILRKLDYSDDPDEYIFWPPLEPEEVALAGGTEITLKA